MFILVNDLSYYNQSNFIWYICGLKYYENPNSNWILASTETLKKKDGIQFCKTKATLLAEILSNQIDEEGFSFKWVIEEVL